MDLAPVVSRDEWLVARKQLLAQEKKASRQRDILNAERRRLPMVKVDKEYIFEGPEGEVGLPDLFEGRRQPSPRLSTTTGAGMTWWRRASRGLPRASSPVRACSFARATTCSTRIRPTRAAATSCWAPLTTST
jgi:hypothetical protein